MIITKSYSHSPKITINVHDDHHQAKRVKVVTRLKDFSGRRRPVSCPSSIIVTTIMTIMTIMNIITIMIVMTTKRSPASLGESSAVHQAAWRLVIAAQIFWEAMRR